VLGVEFQDCALVDRHWVVCDAQDRLALRRHLGDFNQASFLVETRCRAQVGPLAPLFQRLVESRALHVGLFKRLELRLLLAAVVLHAIIRQTDLIE